MAEQRKHRLLQIWTAIYQAIGIAAVLVGAIWFIAGWHSNVNTRLDAIEHHLDRIDIRLDRVLQFVRRRRTAFRDPVSLQDTLQEDTLQVRKSKQESFTSTNKKKSPPGVP